MALATIPPCNPPDGRSWAPTAPRPHRTPADRSARCDAAPGTWSAEAPGPFPSGLRAVHIIRLRSSTPHRPRHRARVIRGASNHGPDPDLLLSILFVAIIVNTARIVGLARRPTGRAAPAVAATTAMRRRRAHLCDARTSMHGTRGWPRAVVDRAEREPRPSAPTAARRPTPSRAAATRRRPSRRAERRALRRARRRAIALTGLLDADDLRPARRRRGRPGRALPPPATVVIFELDGLERLSSASGRTPATGSCRPSPTRSGGWPAAPTTSRASGRAGSASCCPRPTRSRPSTTSSASGGPASCGSSRARSRCAWPSAGRARPATPTLADGAAHRHRADVRRAAPGRPASRDEPATPADADPASRAALGRS